MKIKSIQLCAPIFGMIILSAFSVSASATNINTSGTACHAYNAAQVADIDYIQSGARNYATSPRSVICPVPREPLASGATTGYVYVDGSNAAGTSTSCTLSSYNYNGTFLGSVSFTSSAATYDNGLSLTSAQLSTFAYTAVLCTLPANSGSTIFGVTAIQ